MTDSSAQSVTQKADEDKRLSGKVALVAGATRGAGRGTAVALGEAGATVYCTGRSTRERRSEYDRPETIEETAELVSAAGGVGIAVAVDHLEADQVEALVRRMGTLPAWPRASAKVLIEAMRSDKKKKAGKLRFVLSPRIGKARTYGDVPQEAVVRALHFAPELLSGAGVLHG